MFLEFDSVERSTDLVFECTDLSYGIIRKDGTASSSEAWSGWNPACQ